MTLLLCHVPIEISYSSYKLCLRFNVIDKLSGSQDGKGHLQHNSVNALAPGKATWRQRPGSHYDDVITGAMASQITIITIVYSTVYSGADQSKHQSSASLAFVWGIHRGPVNSPHKWSVTRKMFPFDDVIMSNSSCNGSLPDRTKPLPETILTYQPCCPLRFNWKRFHRKWISKWVSD